MSTAEPRPLSRTRRVRFRPYNVVFPARRQAPGHRRALMPSADIRIALVHLGCARNLIDSETILGRLGAQGYAVTGDVAQADVAVLNTCSFIGPARAESERWIRDLLAAKRRRQLRGVVVVGCLPQKFRADVERKFPQVDAFLGLSDYSNIARVVEEVLKGRKVRDGAGGRAVQGQVEGPRWLQTPRSYAYMRPSNGCDHDCAFCIIPAIRGRQRSKPLEVAVAEAQSLVAQGVREIVLVAEDSTGYGTDFGPGGPRLPDLVEAMAAVEGLRWLRVMYAYPNAFPWRLAQVMRAWPNVVPYLDIPIQHISTPVLRRMRRGGSRDSVERTLLRLRQEVPGITLRTTVLLGHPGEGVEEFEQLLQWLAEFRFERLGAFAFSPEAGTPAGADPERCSADEAQERVRRVLEQQARIHAEHQRARVGRVVEVLVDGRERADALARTQADAPEVDGLVRVADAAGTLTAGDLLSVRVTAAEGYDLRAEPCLSSAPA
ncbi:MAG: 30S ribosomal protein S12 methylthiotransferase RimO [Planctomycetota bacterium]|nr:MAG: 30S ribosomal protein S12 methylthiotransferase RimO [Planctomycetota bacterium]